jgi:hypothetical protein
MINPCARAPRPASAVFDLALVVGKQDFNLRAKGKAGEALLLPTGFLTGPRC